MIRKVIFVVCSLMFLLTGFHTVSAQLTDKDTAVVQFINSRKFFIYKVNKGETLFGISQKFKIPQEEILQFNKDAQKDGIKNKMKLWIPAYSWLNKDTVITKIDKESSPTSYHVGIVTTMNLPKIYTGPDTSLIGDYISHEIKENLEFVEGIFYAAESKKAKSKIHFFVIDSEGDSVKLMSKLRKRKDLNLIITNESGNMLKTLSAFARPLKIKVFSCGVNTYETIRFNEEGFAMMPSAGAQCEQAGKFSAKYFRQPNMIVVRTGATKENERADLFIEGWKMASDKRVIRYPYSKDSSTIGDSLRKNETNVVFLPTSNEEIVSSVLNAIKEKANGDYKLSVIGLPTWQYFETIDQRLLDVCNVHLFSSGMIDYASTNVLAFRKSFRDKFTSEPSEISYQGFDAYNVVDALIQQSQPDFVPDPEQTIRGIYSDYRFERLDSSACYENKVIHIFQPTREGYNDLMKSVKLN